MSKVNYSEQSPYSRTPQGSQFLSRFVDFTVIRDKTDEEIVISPEYQYRPDNLSLAIYNTEEYWWVFAKWNPGIINHSIWDLKAGTRIVVPTLDSIEKSRGNV